MKAWRGPHNGRVCGLDRGQTVHLERLKQHNGGPTELAALPTNGGDIVVIMKPEPECSVGEISDDRSQPSHRDENQLSDTTEVSLPPGRRYCVDTTLQTRIRERGA